MPLAIARPPVSGAPAQPAPPLPDTALDRIIKLIPVDVLTAYVTLQALADHLGAGFLLASFCVGVVLVPLILRLDDKHNGTSAPLGQYVLRTLAFVAWAQAIGDPLAPLGLGDVPRLAAAIVAVILPVIGERLLRPERQP